MDGIQRAGGAVESRQATVLTSASHPRRANGRAQAPPIGLQDDVAHPSRDRRRRGGTQARGPGVTLGRRWRGAVAAPRLSRARQHWIAGRMPRGGCGGRGYAHDRDGGGGEGECGGDGESGVEQAHEIRLGYLAGGMSRKTGQDPVVGRAVRRRSRSRTRLSGGVPWRTTFPWRRAAERLSRPLGDGQQRRELAGRRGRTRPRRRAPSRYERIVGRKVAGQRLAGPRKRSVRDVKPSAKPTLVRTQHLPLANSQVRPGPVGRASCVEGAVWNRRSPCGTSRFLTLSGQVRMLLGAGSG